MAVHFDAEKRTFHLTTPNTSYVMALAGDFGYLLHAYYGPRLRSGDAAWLTRADETSYIRDKSPKDKLSFLDCALMEYPTGGVGDFRDHCLELETPAGHNAVELGYKCYTVTPGKPKLEGLPASFGSDCETLTITLRDPILGLEADLSYTVFEDVDIIARSVRLRNCGETPIILTKVLSACLDMDNEDFSLLTLHGTWARERHMHWRKLGPGYQGVSSQRGETSHQEHPFLALATPGVTQTQGRVYGMHFVYSGNFRAQAAVDQFDSARAVMGMDNYHFRWNLAPGESFQAPEVILTCSDKGLGQMTRSYHKFYREHLIRSPWLHKKRPILINNWEATYFDFNTEKLLSIAREASKLGIEMLVMDDGWFGKRCDDNRALGDWFVNEEKLPGGLAYLVSEVNKLGLKFGIWMEPEMISPDSDLFRAHPDWAIQVPGRDPGLCRNQLVLDITRDEVFDYVWSRIEAILSSANIEYLKWDMNRQLAELGSTRFASGELYHRFVLAVYRLQEKLLQRFPNLLLENCSGGGARFDPGMLYYSPQIWCSDDTDAIERLQIQEGTALIYPLSCIGAHVSDCPNHTVGRVTPFETRGHVALAGTFGYELDITKISQADRDMIPRQVAMYHRYNDLVREGDYYRLASWRENGDHDCWMVVSPDGAEALVTYVQVLRRANVHSRRVKLQGLDPEASYRIGDKTYPGDVLMYAGLPIDHPWGDFKSMLIHLERV